MTWLLPYLGSAAPYAACAAAGAIAPFLLNRYVTKRTTEAFDGAARPFMEAIKPLVGLPDDVNRLGDAVRQLSSRVDGFRTQMEGIQQTANDAHRMAVKALESASAATATAAAATSTILTHLNRFPHAHQNGAGYGDP